MTRLVAVRASSAGQFVAAWDRIASLGDAILPLDPRAPDAHVADLLRRLRPAALVTTAPGRPDHLRTIRLDDPAPVPDGTTAAVTTSGSTGPPRAVLLPEPAVAASTAASLERLGAADGERWLLCLPWHHVAGLAVVRRSRALGVEPVLQDRFDVRDVARAVHDGAVRWVSLVPTQLARLLDAGVGLQRLGGVLLGGAAADDGLLARARDAGVRVVVGYGATETCGGCVYDGRPLHGTSAEVGDDGRIRLTGDVVAGGYHLDPDATAAAFDGSTFTTGDLGRFDGQGRLEVLGRADDVLVSGGENVPAGRVAELVRRHPAVVEAVVVGLPDAEWGSLVAVVVEVPAGVTPPTLDEVRDLVGAEVPRSWAPRRLAATERLPRTSLGKPDREAARRLLA